MFDIECFLWDNICLRKKRCNNHPSISVLERLTAKDDECTVLVYCKSCYKVVICVGAVL